MEEVLQQGRAALRLLALCGGLLLWPLLSPSGNPLETARTIVDGILLPVANDGQSTSDDPLANKPIGVQRPLSQYRYEFNLYSRAGLSSLEVRKVQAEKREALKPVSVAAVLELGDEAFLQESKRTISPLTEIYLSHYRAELGKLESWYTSSGLGRYATLGDLQSAVESRVAVPVLEQLVSVQVLIGCSLAMILLLHAYLFSLLRTAKQIAAPEDWRLLRSWLPFHANCVGRVLTTFNLTVPTLLWSLHGIALPLLRNGTMPTLLSFSVAVLLGLSTIAISVEFRRFGKHVETLMGKATSLPPQTESRLQAVTPRMRNRAA